VGDTTPLASTLIKHQVRTFGPVAIDGYGPGAEFIATVRFDDQCGNGYNTLSLTATVTTPLSRSRKDIEAGGCLHPEIAKHFPELAPLIPYHLCSTDGPMHYIANTLYWLGKSGWTDSKPNSPPHLEHARKTACWPDMPEVMLDLPADHVTAILEQRLPEILATLRAHVRMLGMRY
jgi:hypothetical protein